MRGQLKALRDKMKERGIDTYIVPTTDYHGSEYVNEYFKCREYVSGFTGSAGTLVIRKDFAGLWPVLSPGGSAAGRDRYRADEDGSAGSSFAG